MLSAEDNASTGTTPELPRAADLIRPIAQNLRARRRQHGLSLSALARAAGIAKSTLSDLEHGRGNPSVDTLWALAQALNLPFAALFEDGAAQSVSVIRLEQAPVVAVAETGFRTLHLMSSHSHGDVELYILDLEANASRDAAPHNSNVIEHVVVMSGHVEVGPEGQVERLGPGDYIQFRADVPHRYCAVGGPARLLALHCY